MKEPQWLTDAIKKARSEGRLLADSAASLPQAGGGQEAALRQSSGAADLPLAVGEPVFECSLPYPPSVNHYKRFGTKINKKTKKPYTSLFLTKKGKDYQLAVKRRVRKVRGQALTGPLAIEITTHPPDNLRRDIDNVLKCLLDAMQHAGVYEDDNQIARLLIERGRKVRAEGGSVDVRIRQIALPQPTLW